MVELVGKNSFYRLPLVWHDDSASFDPSGFPLAIHEIDVGQLVLHAMVRLEPGPYVRVVFHGAVDRQKRRLPFFERVKTSIAQPGPFVLFMDPALWLDDALTTGWYLGTEQTDITPPILQVVERVQALTGTEQVLFQGGSAGGFAALQASALVPGSTAFVWNPQTNTRNFLKGPRRLLMDTSFPSLRSAAIERDPARFSCVVRYREAPLRNSIYYVQNRGDVNHWEPHFTPFAEALGLPAAGGDYLGGAVRFVEIDQGYGHLPLRAPEWDQHLAQAEAMLAAAGCFASATR